MVLMGIMMKRTGKALVYFLAMIFVAYPLALVVGFPYVVCQITEDFSPTYGRIWTLILRKLIEIPVFFAGRIADELPFMKQAAFLHAMGLPKWVPTKIPSVGDIPRLMGLPEPPAALKTAFQLYRRFK